MLNEALRRPLQRSLVPVLACVVAGLTTPVGAQTDAGALRVLVTGQSQAVVPGATIEVVNVATNTQQTSISDGGGYGQFVPLPRGTYAVRVSLEGFQTVEVSNVRVDVNERRFLPVSLALAAAAAAGLRRLHPGRLEDQTDAHPQPWPAPTSATPVAIC